MKWTPKEKKERKKEPDYGHIRSKRCFAWLPTTLQGGNVVWLESYWRKQRWEKNAGGISHRGMFDIYFYDGWVTMYEYQ